MVQIIVNGGEPLNDCPTNWDKAKEWQDNANKDSEGGWERPEWKWDCGFKLDYDGPILRVSSRFYPPKSHYGETWDGTVSIFIFDRRIHEQKFDCKTLEDLKREVEGYVKKVKEDIAIYMEGYFKK